MPLNPNLSFMDIWIFKTFNDELPRLQIWRMKSVKLQICTESDLVTIFVHRKISKHIYIYIHTDQYTQVSILINLNMHLYSKFFWPITKIKYVLITRIQYLNRVPEGSNLFGLLPPFPIKKSLRSPLSTFVTRIKRKYPTPVVLRATTNSPTTWFYLSPLSRGDHLLWETWVAISLCLHETLNCY